jgi:hypothetical protein
VPFARPAIALGKKLLDDRIVPIKPGGLKHRRGVSLKPKPRHALKDDPNGLIRGPFSIGILDSEDEPPAMAASL